MMKSEYLSGILFLEIEKKLSLKFLEPVKVIRKIPLRGGCIHHAVRIDTTAGNFFLKWNSFGPADIFIREAEGLEELSHVGTKNILIPKVILSSEIAEMPGFLLLEYLSPEAVTARDENKLGRGLAEIHRFRGNFFGFHHDNYCGSTPQINKQENTWIKFFSENRILFLLKLITEKGSFSLKEAMLIEKLVSRLRAILPHNSEPMLIHGDLWSGNYLITSKGPALIDPAAYYADREMEFGILTLFGGFGKDFWQGYNEIYPLPEDWKERNPIYQLYHLLNHYYLFGGSYGNEALRIAGYFAG